MAFTKLPQGADDVQVKLPHLQGLEERGALAHHQINDIDQALGRVGVRHGQGDALAFLIGPQDHELPRFGLGRDLGALIQLLMMVPWAISWRSTISNIRNSPPFVKIGFPKLFCVSGAGLPRPSSPAGPV